MATLNRYSGSDPVSRRSDRTRRKRRMSRYEVHNVFRAMVRWELRNGHLSAWRRRKLVQYAASLHLSAVEAGELIQEAIRAEAREQGSGEVGQPRPVPPPAAGRAWPTWAKLGLALAVVVLVQAMMAAFL